MCRCAAEGFPVVATDGPHHGARTQDERFGRIAAGRRAGKDAGALVAGIHRCPAGRARQAVLTGVRRPTRSASARGSRAACRWTRARRPAHGRGAPDPRRRTGPARCARAGRRHRPDHRAGAGFAAIPRPACERTRDRVLDDPAWPGRAGTDARRRHGRSAHADRATRRRFGVDARRTGAVLLSGIHGTALHGRAVPRHSAAERGGQFPTDGFPGLGAHRRGESPCHFPPLAPLTPFGRVSDLTLRMPDTIHRAPGPPLRLTPAAGSPRQPGGTRRKREPGGNPGLPRSGERERPPSYALGPHRAWEATASRCPRLGTGKGAPASPKTCHLPACGTVRTRTSR